MWQSKKFVSFHVIEWTWKALIAYGIYIGLDSTVLLGMVGASGTAETAYLGATAWQDRGVRTAQIQTQAAAPVRLTE